VTGPVPPFSPRVVEFAGAHVDSLLQLEALLLVFESGRVARTSADIAAEMYLPERVVDAWLQDYAADGFCESTDAGFRAPDDAEAYALLAEVSDAYVRRKVSFGRLVFGAQETDPKISLAEAFRIRRDKEDR